MVTRQAFKTTDVCRLEIGTPPTGSLVNRVRNPNGHRGPWGWLSPALSASLSSSATTAADDSPDTAHQLTYTTTALAVDVAAYVDAERVFAPVGQWVASQIRLKAAIPAGRSITLRTVLYDAAGVAQLAPSINAPAGSAAGTVWTTPPWQIPAGVVYMATRIQVFNSVVAVREAVWDQTMLVTAATQAAVTPAAGGLAFVEPYVWTNILGPATAITIDRQPLDLGLLTITLRDTTLSPVTSALIRAGRPIRVLAQSGSTVGAWRYLFDGEIVKGLDSYDALTYPTATKRTRISITAVDPAKTLANMPQPSGVGLVTHLPYVLETSGVPWEINGLNAQPSGDPVYVAVNKNASMLDQIGIVRDSTRSHAWVSRSGILKVQEPANWSTVENALLGDGTYRSDPELDFDTAQCINVLIIRRLYLDAIGDTVEELHGPYRDAASVDEWGPLSAEMTVQGLSVAQVDTLAAAVLATNATPRLAVRRITLAIGSLADLAETAGNYRAHLDLYDLVRVTNSRSGTNTLLRVTSIRHRITPTKWLVDLGFDHPSGVALPSTVPPLPVNGAQSFADTPWANLTLSGAWTASDARVPRYRRLNGEVHMKGLAGGGTGTIGVLPPGFRPAPSVINEHHFPVICNAASGGVWVSSGGSISFGFGSNVWVDLSPIRFQAGA